MGRQSQQPQRQPAQLSHQKMAAAIPKIDRRIADIDGFDVTSITDRGDPRIDALGSKLDALLSSIFGSDTVEYHKYQWPITHLDTAPVSYMHETSIHEVHEGLKRGLATAKAQLEAIRSHFIEELDDAGYRAGETTAEEAEVLAGLHPDILKGCKALLDAAAYPEAVERSFKIVRDRLRKLSGYETASEAFGKGHLYVNGAAAENVDRDFNQGTKFLMMAIDMFRNEKSHTSEGNINDLTHAYQYLMVSSLARRFLDRAEVRRP